MRTVGLAVALGLIGCKGKAKETPTGVASDAVPVVLNTDALDEEATAVEPDPGPPTPSLTAASDGLGPGVLGAVVVAGDGGVVYCGAEDDGASTAVEIGCQKGTTARQILLSLADSAALDGGAAAAKDKLAAATAKMKASLGTLRALPRVCEVLTGDDPPCTALGATVTIDDQGKLTVTGPKPLTETFAPRQAVAGAGSGSGSGSAEPCTAELRSADVFADTAGKRLAIVARIGATDGACAILSSSELRVVGP